MLRKLSHTRGVYLTVISGLCFILGENQNPLSVKDLVEKAQKLGILENGLVSNEERLSSRANHYMIALRELELVKSKKEKNHTYYDLKTAGIRIYQVVKGGLFEKGTPEWNFRLREVWRNILVESEYVRQYWLKYFMDKDNFSYEELLDSKNWLTIYRVPIEDRNNSLSDANNESGYIIESSFWEKRSLNNLEYREIYQGLRRWTNEAQLTDDRIPDYLSQMQFSNQNLNGTFEVESHLIKNWFDPKNDVVKFSNLLNSLFDRLQTNRITMPDLIINLCSLHSLSKINVKELMIELFYNDSSFFFERGSKFLIENAYDRSYGAQSYYIQIEGVWRTGVVRR